MTSAYQTFRLMCLEALAREVPDDWPERKLVRAATVLQVVPRHEWPAYLRQWHLAAPEDTQRIQEIASLECVTLPQMLFQLAHYVGFPGLHYAYHHTVKNHQPLMPTPWSWRDSNYEQRRTMVERVHWQWRATAKLVEQLGEIDAHLARMAKDGRTVLYQWLSHVNDTQHLPLDVVHSWVDWHAHISRMVLQHGAQDDKVQAAFAAAPFGPDDDVHHALWEDLFPAGKTVHELSVAELQTLWLRLELRLGSVMVTADEATSSVPWITYLVTDLSSDEDVQLHGALRCLAQEAHGDIWTVCETPIHRLWAVRSVRMPSGGAPVEGPVVHALWVAATYCTMLYRRRTGHQPSGWTSLHVLLAPHLANVVARHERLLLPRHIHADVCTRLLAQRLGAALSDDVPDHVAVLVSQ